MRQIIVFLCCVCSIVSIAHAQETQPQQADTVSIEQEGNVLIPENIEDIPLMETPDRIYEPRKATMFSAVLPGLGQAYNRRYWKIPLVYGGFVALGYFINFNHEFYLEFERTLIASQLQEDMSEYRFGQLQQATLESRSNRFQRDRDFLIILTGMLYMLNIVDAHVDAHLRGFDISDELSMQFKPSMGGGDINAPGLSLVISFR